MKVRKYVQEVKCLKLRRMLARRLSRDYTYLAILKRSKIGKMYARLFGNEENYAKVGKI